MGLATVFLVFVMGAGGASIGDDPDFVRAQELYVDLECELALQKLSALEAKKSWQRPERAQIALWQALCFAQLSQNEQEAQALARAVEFDPNIEAPPYTPPKVLDALVAVREKARTQQAATAAAKIPAPKVETQKIPKAGAPDEPASSEANAPPATPDETNLAQIGTGAMVLGGVGLLGGVVSAGFAVPNAIAARDPKAFQQDANEKAAIANQQLIAGAVLLGAGVLLLGGGLALTAIQGE